MQVLFAWRENAFVFGRSVTDPQPAGAMLPDAEWTSMRMGMAFTVARYMADDLDHFPDDGNRYELLDGVRTVTPGAWRPPTLDLEVAVDLGVIFAGLS